MLSHIIILVSPKLNTWYPVYLQIQTNRIIHGNTPFHFKYFFFENSAKQTVLSSAPQRREVLCSSISCLKLLVVVSQLLASVRPNNHVDSGCTATKNIHIVTQSRDYFRSVHEHGCLDKGLWCCISRRHNFHHGNFRRLGESSSVHRARSHSFASIANEN